MKRVIVGLVTALLVPGGLTLAGLDAGTARARPTGALQWCPGQDTVPVTATPTGSSLVGRETFTVRRTATSGTETIRRNQPRRPTFRPSCAGVSFRLINAMPGECDDSRSAAGL
jgi:hypothetical protein